MEGKHVMRVTNKLTPLEAQSSNNTADQTTTRSRQRQQLIMMSSVLGASLLIAVILQVTAHPRLTGAQPNPIDDTLSAFSHLVDTVTSDDQVVPGETTTNISHASTSVTSSAAVAGDSTIDVNITNDQQPAPAVSSQSQSSTTVNINGQDVPVTGNGSIHKTIHTTGNNSSSLNISINSQSSSGQGDGM